MAKRKRKPKPTNTQPHRPLDSESFGLDGRDRDNRLFQVGRGEVSRAGGGYRIIRSHHGDL